MYCLDMKFAALRRVTPDMCQPAYVSMTNIGILALNGHKIISNQHVALTVTLVERQVSRILILGIGHSNV